LAANLALAVVVERDLALRWSPQQIAARLKTEFPDDPEMWVSHETIYRALFVQGRGGLRKELTACLRSGRTRRRGHNTRNGLARPKLTNMVMISDRPPEADDRAVPGHWEGDLIIGAEAVRHAMTAKILTLPESLRRSITWDQGSEMAQHVQFRVDTGVQIYFCDPHSPWMRGSNENTNGLLRQYFPKGTDLSIHPAAHLDAVADELNGRPRQTLAWMTPSERFSQLVAITA
jgi:IS30 family transposase